MQAVLHAGSGDARNNGGKAHIRSHVRRVTVMSWNENHGKTARKSPVSAARAAELRQLTDSVATSLIAHGINLLEPLFLAVDVDLFRNAVNVVFDGVSAVRGRVPLVLGGHRGWQG
jgi:hypothetical protein